MMKPLASAVALILLANILKAETINVDANANRRTIDPRIYGIAYGDATTLSDLNVPLNRLGGNNTSRYNWQQNADNRGFDWYFESIGDSSATAGERGDSFITMSRTAGAQPMMTIPMVGYVAKLGTNRSKLASYSIAKYGAQTGSDWQWFPDAGNGVLQSNGQEITNNNPLDANISADSTFQQAWVQHIVSTHGTAANGGLRYYILDNEYSIWHSTHRDVHPTGATMDEIKNKMIDYATKIKAVDPGALIVGPEEWGWSGYIYSGYDQQWGSKNGWSNLPDRANHGGMDYLPYLLSQINQASTTAGKRLLDVFTVHYYPQGGEFSDDTSSAMQSRRNRSTRSLWDPNYVDETWIGTQVKLIPRLKGWVTQYYPNTPIGITEYNWGAENHINGATTQADVLGIFGREGLDLAARWTTPAASTPTYKAMKMYRNYDGNKSTFGETSVSASVTNPDNLSAFAALRSSDGAMTVMVINKATSSSSVTLNLANFSAASAAQRWQLTSSNAIAKQADVTVSSNSLSATVPAQSITLFIVPAGSVVTAPAAPSNLSATAASSSQINLAWTDNANNETGFKIERKTGAGGTYAQIATVGANVTSYSNTGLNASTQYYYRVRANNSGGDSAFSNEANATTQAAPVPPPTAPSNLSATAVSSSQINLSWTDNANNETGFKIERKTGAGGTYAQIGTVGSNVTSYNNTGLTASTQYYYRVRANNASGDSAFSNEDNATTQTAPAPPAAPSNLGASATSSSQINLSWTDNANTETGFKIERKTGAGDTFAQIGTVGSNTTSFNDTGLTASTQYYYRVRATNASGDSAFSNEANATTQAAPPPPPTFAVTIDSVSTGKTYSLGTAQVGALQYTDRSYKITALSNEINGGVLVRQANNDKNVTAAAHITLTTNGSATIYICYDKRVKTLPAWLSGWALTGLTISTSDKAASPMKVYSKAFTAGQVVLGGNAQAPESGAQTNYIPVLVPDVAVFAASAEANPLAPGQWKHDGDSDGDGLLDIFETAVGLDPNNIDTGATDIVDEEKTASNGMNYFDYQIEWLVNGGTGGGTGGNSGGVQATPFTPLKLRVSLNFKSPGHDAITLNASLPLTQLPAAGSEVTANVGGVSATFTLGKNSRAKATDGAVRFIKSKKFGFAFALSLKGDFAITLADDGLTAVDAKDAAATVPLQLNVSGITYAASANGMWSASASRSGRFSTAIRK